jgi:ABC-type glutathione transport system ATPase component
MMDSEKLLEITGLSVRYPNRTKDTLRDINLTLHRAEITCVIGESGCGKSTLLNAIMQLPGKVELSDGCVAFKGKEIKTLSKRELQQLRGSGIGVVFQEPGASLNPIRKTHVQFYEAMRAHEHITKTEARGRAAEILESLEF